MSTHKWNWKTVKSKSFGIGYPYKHKSAISEALSEEEQNTEIGKNRVLR